MRYLSVTRVILKPKMCLKYCLNNCCTVVTIAVVFWDKLLLPWYISVDSSALPITQFHNRILLYFLEVNNCSLTRLSTHLPPDLINANPSTSLTCSPPRVKHVSLSVCLNLCPIREQTSGKSWQDSERQCNDSSSMAIWHVADHLLWLGPLFPVLEPEDTSLATSTTLLLCLQSVCSGQPEPKGQTSPTPRLAHTYCPRWKAPVISPTLLVFPWHFSSADLGCARVGVDSLGGETTWKAVMRVTH